MNLRRIVCGGNKPSSSTGSSSRNDSDKLRASNDGGTTATLTKDGHDASTQNNDVPRLKRQSWCSFALIFVVAALVQLSASIVIWWLGYMNSRDSVAALSNAFRESLLTGATNQVTTILNQPVAAMNRMDYLMQRQYRTLCDVNYYSNYSQFWADLTTVGLEYYPYIGAVGFGCRRYAETLCVNCHAVFCHPLD